MASAPPGSGLAPGSKYLGTSYPDPMYYQQQAQAFGNSLLLTSQVIQQQQQQQAQQDQAQMRLYLQAAAEDPGAAAGMSDSMAPIAQRNPGFATIIAATKNRGRLADLMTSSVDDFQNRLDGKLKDTTAALATASAMPDTLPPPMITDPATGQSSPAPSIVAGPGGYPMVGPPQGPQPNPHKQAALQHLQAYMGVGGEPTATPPMLSDVLGEMGGKPAMAAYTGLKHLYGIDLGQEAGVNAWGGQLAGTVKNSWMQELPPAMRGYALARGFKSPQEFQQAASNPSDPAFHMVQAEAGMEPSGSEKARLDAETQRQGTSQAAEAERERVRLEQAGRFHADTMSVEKTRLGLEQKRQQQQMANEAGAPTKELAKQADTEFNQWMKDRSASMPKGASPRQQTRAEQDFERANPRPFNGADTRRIDTAVAKITTSPKASVGGQKPDPDTVRQGVRSLYEQNRARGMNHEAALLKATNDTMAQANR